MVLLIDTNVLLDVIQKRKGLCASSEELWKKCETKGINGYISALTMPNIAYIARATLTPEIMNEICRILTRVFSVVDLRGIDAYDAAALKWKDYEDALQYCAAKRVHADYIITRNGKDFEETDIPCLTPEEFLGLA